LDSTNAHSFLLGFKLVDQKKFYHGIGERYICECKLEYQSSSGHYQHKSKYHSGIEVVYPPGWYFARICKFCMVEFDNIPLKMDHLRSKCVIRKMYQEMKEAMEKQKERPPLTFSCDDEEITVPLVGHLQARPGEVVLPFDNYLAYRCPVTHRTRKVVSGIYTLEHVIYNKLIRECDPDRHYETDPRLEKELQKIYEVIKQFNDWFDSESRKLDSMKRPPDRQTRGHICAHILGGSSFLTSITTHPERFNSLQFLALESLARRTVKDGGFVDFRFIYHDFTREECLKFLADLDSPEPFRVVFDDGLVYPTPLAAAFIICAKRPNGKYCVFSFLVNEFGLEADRSLCLPALMAVSFEVHLNRLSKHFVGLKYISEMTGEPALPKEVEVNLDSVNSLKPEQWLFMDKVPSIVYPNPHHR
jgi:hypothetical protein